MRNGKGVTAVLLASGLIGLAALRGKLRRYEIVESSMEPALRQGDYIIAQHRRTDLRRGDIAIVPHPGVFGFDLIKRVVGLPGELVTIVNGQVHIDGKALDEAWADGPVHPDGQTLLGAGSVFVLGDNRPMSSADSRTIGGVPSVNIKWVAVARYWPLARIGRLG